jgi:predicted Zn-dependent protease
MQRSELYIKIKIFPLYKLLLLVGFVVVMLYLLFPKEINKKILKLSTGANIGLSIKYLEYYTKLSDNPAYLYLLAKEYVEIGNFKKAHETLAKLKNTFKVLQVKYEIYKTMYLKNKKSRKKILENIYYYQNLMLEKANLKELGWLKKEILMFGNYDLYIKLLQKIYEKTHSKNAADELIKALISQKRFLETINIINSLVPNLNKLDKKRYLKKALEIALWSEDYKTAKIYIEKLIPYAKGDISLIKYLIKTSLAINRPKLAYKIVNKLLKGI